MLEPYEWKRSRTVLRRERAGNCPDLADWNRLGLAPLREALHTNRWKQPGLEKAAGSFLRQKYQTSDPVRQYTAFRIWEGYLVAREYRNRNAACERFIESVSPFTLAFQTNTTADFEKRTGRPAPPGPSYRLPSRLLPEDSRLDLWYPDHQTGLECACTYDLLYKNECQNWRNKINKAKKTDGFPDERLEEMKNAFEAFKKEALQRKRLIRTGESNAKEFTDWLYRQANDIVKLAEEWH